MNERLRCADVIEFAALEVPTSKASLALLKSQETELFPKMTYDRVEEWMGHRPSTPDSPPFIGHAPLTSKILLEDGH